MNNFGEYITIDEAIKRTSMSAHDLARLAMKEPATCPNCDEEEWLLGGCGLCFSCTTGEADASDDCELVRVRPADTGFGGDDGS